MFKGSIVALVTPMLESGSIDYDCFSRLIDWHLSNGTDGIVVLGTTGESPTIHADERKELISLAVQQIGGRIPVIVGTGTNDTNHSIELTEQAKELGADAALLVTPYYNKPTQEGLFLHFRTIAQDVSLPLILYNVPARTACDMQPETIIRLSQISNIVGLKEATGDINRVKQILDSGCKIDLLSGDDATALDFMLNGGKGVISVVANIAPRAFHDLCMAAISGNNKLAKEIDLKLRPVYEALFLESNPIPTKWALQSMGLIPSGIRLPLTLLAEKHHAPVRAALEQAGI